MSLRDVVRRDLREALRTRGGVGAFVVLALSLALPSAEVLSRPLDGQSLFRLVVMQVLVGVHRYSPTQVEQMTTTDTLVVVVGTAAVSAVPLVALLVSYNAVLAERQRGTIRFLLGLPNSRLAVVLGKVIARSAVVALPVAVALAAVAVAVDGAFPALTLFGYVLLLGVCFVSIGVAVSVATTGGRRAVALAVGAYVVLRGLWRPGQFGYHAHSTGDLVPTGTYPEWFYLTSRLNPIHAAQTGIAASVGTASPVRHPFVAYAPPGSVYAADWLPAAVLVGWTVAATGLGYVRFRRTDIG